MKDEKYVNIEELRRVSIDIENKKNMIMDIYNSNIKKILYNYEKIAERNLDIPKEKEIIFKELFTKFDNNMTELIELLTYKIIPNYEELAFSINKSFNDTFAKKMSNYLDLEVNENEKQL